MITTSALCGNGFDMEGLLKASAEGFRDLIAFAGDGEAMEEGYCRLIFYPHGRPSSRPSRRLRKKRLDGRVMCGWPPPCKGFVTVTAKRSLAVMCPAWLRGWIAAGLDGNRGSRPDQ